MIPRSLKYWTLSTVLGGEPELQEVEVKAWPKDLRSFPWSLKSLFACCLSLSTAVTVGRMLFSERQPIYASTCMTISGERTEQHVVIGFGELAADD